MKTYNQRLHEDFYRKIEYTRQLVRENNDCLHQENRRLFRLAHGTINNYDYGENFVTKNNRYVCFGTNGAYYGDDYTETKIKSLLIGLSKEEIVDKLQNVIDSLTD